MALLVRAPVNLLCALAGFEVTGDSTLSPTLVVRVLRVLTLSLSLSLSLSLLTLSLSMFPNRTRRPETTILDERLRAITRDADALLKKLS